MKKADAEAVGVCLVVVISAAGVAVVLANTFAAWFLA